jgi:hypothetical protein
MMYNTQNDWVFELWLSSGILENTTFRKLEYVSSFPPHLKTETDPVSETLCFLFSRIPDDGQESKNAVILGKISLLECDAM